MKKKMGIPFSFRILFRQEKGSEKWKRKRDEFLISSSAFPFLKEGMEEEKEGERIPDSFHLLFLK